MTKPDYTVRLRTIGLDDAALRWLATARAEAHKTNCNWGRITREGETLIFSAWRKHPGGTFKDSVDHLGNQPVSEAAE